MEVHAGKIKTRFAQLVMAGCIVALSACAAIYRDHGYVPTDEELAAITVGVSTQQDVASAIGRPSAAGLLNDTGWYYVQSRFEQFGPKAPVEIDRQVLAVSFSAGGVVENIERFGLEDGRVVALSRRVTESNIKGVGFLSQLFSNVGRLRAQDIVSE
jgi:outer membrane protein assembly factor BamE (lipoprotein component of BamABCDE complex)